MKAVVLEEIERIVNKDIPVPEPESNEVLVEVKACGLCNTDLSLYKGKYKAKMPVVLGHEFSGDIVKVCGENSNFKIGDRVVVDPNVSCGACNWCRSAKPCFCENIAAYGVLKDGGFAEYVKVKQGAVYKIPEGVDYAAASFAEPVSCIVHAIDRAGIKPGDKVLIMGGGPTGQILLQMAKLSGASELIMVTRSRWKLDLAKKLGATRLVNAGKEDVAKSTMDLTSGMGVDVVIEAVGTPSTIGQAVCLARRGGKIVIFGLSPQNERASFSPFDVLYKELTILGSWVNPYTFPRALGILASGQIDLTPLISRELNLDEVTEGFKLMAEKPEGFMKAVIKP